MILYYNIYEMDEKNMILFILFKFEIYMVINLICIYEINMVFFNLFCFMFYNINVFKMFKLVKSEIVFLKLEIGNCC